MSTKVNISRDSRKVSDQSLVLLMLLSHVLYTQSFDPEGIPVNL